MSDEYHVFYIFNEGIGDGQLDEFFRRFDDKWEIIWPQDGDINTYVDALTSTNESVVAKEFETEIGLLIDDELIGLPYISISIGERWIMPLNEESDSDAIKRMNNLYGLFGEMYETFIDVGLEPVYVFGTNFVERGPATNPEHAAHVSREKILNNEIPGIYWFQILPPAMVEGLGENRVRSTPAFRNEELSNGASLLATSQGVLTGAVENHVDDAAEHLGLPYVQ